MLSFLSWFLIFNLLYHIFTTLTVYGLELWATTLPSLLRETIWCGFLAIIFLLNIKQWKSYRKKWGKSWLAFGGLLVFSVLISYFLQHKGFSDIFIGIKYGFWWMFILLSASSIGFFYREKFMNLNLHTRLKRGLIATVIIGFLRQGLKLWKPDLFAHIGYELKLDDFHFGEKPPIYYLTGYEGKLRWQGLFAWPNNYGYFLVAFFPLILLFFGITPLHKSTQRGFRNELLHNIKSLTLFQWFNIGMLTLRILAMVMSLSRAVLLGGVLALVITNRSFFKQHKKLLLRGGIGCLGVLLLLSLMKRQSTIGHLTSKLAAFPHIINQPLGYGLGTSWPAIHHNGTILPENYYFQIMLDVGTIGFLLRAVVMFQLIKIQRQITTPFMKGGWRGVLSEQEQILYLIFNRIQIWFLVLLCIGLVLHVFEDSMVNYLFFIVYGILLGSLSTPWSSSSRYKAP